MPEHENEHTDCEKLLSAIEDLADAIDQLVAQINGGENDAAILEILKPIARALLNLTQIYEEHCQPNDNGNGNG